MVVAAVTGARGIVVGVKSVAAIAVAALLLAIGGWQGALAPGHLAHLSGDAAFLIGLVATLAVALVGVGWRFGARSHAAIAVVDRRLVILDGVDRLDRAARPRELPAALQQVLLLAGLGAVMVGALGNHGAARLAQLPDDLAEPAPSEYCLPEPATPAGQEPAPPPPPPPEDQPGCALVKRAYELGYARSLGTCAPRQAAPVAVSPVTRRELCTRRQLDEPYLHYGFRRVAEAFSSAASVDPVAAARHRVAELETHLAHLDGPLGHVRHAITGTPHAAHHVWITLPDPHPGSLADHILGEERCAQRFADLPLWPAWRAGDEARLVEHVLGQLLFATRFGTTASCTDYVIHWSAAPDTCQRILGDPIAALDREGALSSVRSVLDRRARQLELVALAEALGRPPPLAPPAAAAIVSLSCLIVDPTMDPRGPGSTTGATGASVAIDGDAIGVREIRVPRVRVADDGPIDVYAALADLLGGRDTSVAGAAAAAAAAPPEPVAIDGSDFLLVRLDPLIEGDPFRGARAPLSRPELVAIYPFEHHLHGYIDGFRRRYLVQRGRL
jgi:hypothetical protein